MNTEPINALFIGGPRDGQFITLPAPAPQEYLIPVLNNGTASQERYNKRVYPCKKGEATFYVHENIASLEIEQRIIIALLDAR